MLKFSSVPSFLIVFIMKRCFVKCFPTSVKVIRCFTLHSGSVVYYTGRFSCWWLFMSLPAAFSHASSFEYLTKPHFFHLWDVRCTSCLFSSPLGPLPVSSHLCIWWYSNSRVSFLSLVLAPFELTVHMYWINPLRAPLFSLIFMLCWGTCDDFPLFIRLSPNSYWHLEPFLIQSLTTLMSCLFITNRNWVPPNNF